MTKNKRILLLAAVAAFTLTAALSAIVQTISGKPGSSSATETIGGKQLPPPPAKFGGVIKESAKHYRPNNTFVYDVTQSWLILGVTFNVR